jgi:hypothetical protein
MKIEAAISASLTGGVAFLLSSTATAQQLPLFRKKKPVAGNQKLVAKDYKTMTRLSDEDIKLDDGSTCVCAAIVLLEALVSQIECVCATNVKFRMCLFAHAVLHFEY